MKNKDHKPLDPEGFKTQLRKQKMKATPQRMAVHEAMLALVHASADMVASYIKEKSEVKVTGSSVYNILSSLADAGIYARRLSTDGKMYFDVNSFFHLHLYDTVNNAYRDVFDEDLNSILHEKLSRKKFKGFRIDGADLQILCHPTRKYNRKEAKEQQ